MLEASLFKTKGFRTTYSVIHLSVKHKRIVIIRISRNLLEVAKRKILEVLLVWFELC